MDGDYCLRNGAVVVFDQRHHSQWPGMMGVGSLACQASDDLATFLVVLMTILVGFSIAGENNDIFIVMPVIIIMISVTITVFCSALLSPVRIII